MTVSVQRKSMSRRSIRGLKKGKWWLVGLAIFPWALSQLIFTVYPLAWSFVVSLTDYDPNMPSLGMPFVGLKHYVTLLNTQNAMFLAFINTVEYAFLMTVTRLVLGLIVALLVRASGKLKSFFRAVYFAPTMVSGVVIMMMWEYLLQPRLGLVNTVLRTVGSWIGVSLKVNFLIGSNVLYTVVGIQAWAALGFTLILYLAAMDNIPQDYYDAAKVDGAGMWSTFRHIQLPLILPVILFTVVTGVIGGMGVFTPFWMLGNSELAGTPTPRHLTLVLLVYRRAFSRGEAIAAAQIGRFAEAQALAWATFGFTLLLTAVQWKGIRRRFQY